MVRDDGERLKIRAETRPKRIIKDIRRRIRVVGAFPDAQSGLHRAAARLRHIVGSEGSRRKYMSIAPLHAEQTFPHRAVAGGNLRRSPDTPPGTDSASLLETPGAPAI